MEAESSTRRAGARVSLQKITAATVGQIFDLEVAPRQRSFVAPNAVSIAQAYFEPGAWFRAIYAGATPVGFVMLFDQNLPGVSPPDDLEPNEIELWRFMIDHRYQRRGFGRAALDAIREHVRMLGWADRLLASCVPGPDGPEAFYLNYGFAKTGRMQGEEIEIWIRP
ncbi:MAG: GNAT family N-acetyltransferase [Pseudomonadota bacterium]